MSRQVEPEGSDREALERTAILPTRRPSREQIVRRALILIAVYTIPLRVIAQPVLDLDIWWHLRTGEWIVEHRAVPTTDPFSAYGSDKSWVAYSWLFEVLAYLFFNCFGLFGVVLYRTLLSFSVLIALHRFVARRQPRFLIASGLTALAFLAISPLLTERPWHFTILFSILTLEVISDLRAGSRSWLTYLLPVCYALWANLHIEFVYGLALLGLACVAPWIDRALGRLTNGDGATAPRSPVWWQLVAVTIACGAATLVNPYFQRVYDIVLEFATGANMYDVITELHALQFRQWANWAVLALVGMACFALGRRPAPGAFHILLLVAAAYISFRSQRDAFVAVLAAVSILTPSRRVEHGKAEFPFTFSRVALVAVGILAVAISLGWKNGLSEHRLWERVGTKFPARAAAVVEERGYPGPLYNSIDWGGYLIWRLREYPVSIDGRANVHGDLRFGRAAAILLGHSSWADDPELDAANLIVIEVNRPLANLLRLDSRFEIVHEDPVALVFIRRSRPGH